VSFWRYKLLELVVLVVTFPLFVLAFLSWGWLYARFADPTTGAVTFLLFAVPFVIVCLILTNWITKRAERWWISRHQDADGSANETMRR
jgi:hypothetical protein